MRLEGERLDRYIQNLLDMTRLGHGGLTLNRDWIGVDELIGSATTRLQRYQPDVRFDITLAKRTGATVGASGAGRAGDLQRHRERREVLAAQAKPIAIDARDIDGVLRIDVADRGPGIPEDERKRIFDMFFSVERGDRGRQGTGLGLAITQGMIGAHGGSVEALPGYDGRGTTIRIMLPRMQPATTP